MIRTWEVGNLRRSFANAEGAAVADGPAGQVVPTWDAPDSGVVHDWLGSWDSTIGTADTGPGGLVVRDLDMPSGYDVAYGRVWRIDGTVYLIGRRARSYRYQIS
jgi:hypothetical protein